MLTAGPRRGAFPVATRHQWGCLIVCLTSLIWAADSGYKILVLRGSLGSQKSPGKPTRAAPEEPSGGGQNALHLSHLISNAFLKSLDTQPVVTGLRGGPWLHRENLAIHRDPRMLLPLTQAE